MLTTVSLRALLQARTLPQRKQGSGLHFIRSLASETPTTNHGRHNLRSLSQSATAAGPVVRFKDVSFAHNHHEILETVDFSIPQGSKVTIMGQNGAGKSTIIKLMSKLINPDEGQVLIRHGERVACAMQTMPLACRDWTVNEFFAHQLTAVTDVSSTATGATLPAEVETLAHYEFEAKKAKALKAVVLNAPGDRIIKSFSGGQQARLLLAAALITKPTVLLLDEPTNNLDSDGLYHLQNLITTTEKTCVVISHDEDFLNSFTDQVLYLDIFSKKIETYQGNYYNVKTEIAKRIKRENAENARRQEKAQEKKDQANKFAKKGGNLRKVAKTMRKVATEMEDGLVDVRKEDVSLRNFVIPYTPPAVSSGKLVRISQVSGYQRSAPIQGGPIEMRKASRVQVCGPNGIGKTTFLEMIVAGTAPGVTVEEEASVGYYRQDFHNFDFGSTVMACLETASDRKHTNEQLYTTAAAFLLRGKSVMAQQVGTLSEGQKGLLSLACLTLQQPSILILDEVTNHINFRHLPALVHAIRSFEGPILLVSHDHHFASSIGVDTTIDMGKELQSSLVSTNGSEMGTKGAVAA